MRRILVLALIAAALTAAPGDGLLVLTLLGDFDGDPSVTLDGSPAPASVNGHALVVKLDLAEPGPHALTIS